ncbi:hypothetical protein N7516_006559 [Penicillium verrucosum]|uniref:uncharacterized protein n=1 Tax=Penicillium verrucosum TaxID=60171 RepID=UPI0025452B76|nr:uncharacterized protein N7516_006559 [Penicillium verrucosum]KAJ5932070.1 hypothetical protein N7516_006559 [Penicillium verrucosum]
MFGFGFEISKSQTENSQVTYYKKSTTCRYGGAAVGLGHSGVYWVRPAYVFSPPVILSNSQGNRRSAPLYSTSTLESNQSRKKLCTFHHYRISRCVEGASPSFEVTRPAAMCALHT